MTHRKKKLWQKSTYFFNNPCIFTLKTQLSIFQHAYNPNIGNRVYYESIHRSIHVNWDLFQINKQFAIN